MIATTRRLEDTADIDALIGVIATLEGCTFDQARGFVTGLRESLGDAFEDSLVFAVQQQQIVGAVVLRPMPMGHCELFGGVPAHPERHDISLALLRGARVAAPDAVLATFASDLYWEVSALEPLGFKTVAQYQRLQATAPHLEEVALPAGFTVSSYAETPDLEGLVAGLRCYEDMWGHHRVDPTQVAVVLSNYDPALIWLARDAVGGIAGVCRATLDDGKAWIDAPGVRSDARGSNLHRALIGQALHALSARDAKTFTLESWGESASNSADYLELGFTVLESEAIVAWDA